MSRLFLYFIYIVSIRLTPDIHHLVLSKICRQRLFQANFSISAIDDEYFGFALFFLGLKAVCVCVKKWNKSDQGQSVMQNTLYAGRED